jgi:hypothetical protein
MVMSQTIPCVPIPPPGVCRAFVILAKNIANALLWGPNNATKSPRLETYIDEIPLPWETKYKFSEDFGSKKSNASSISYQYICI